MLLARGQGGANEQALAYRADLLARGLAAATINRRLAALRGLVKLARVLGQVGWTLEVDGVRSEAYRDTRGPGRPGFLRLLGALAGREDARAVRDLATPQRYDDNRRDVAGDVARRVAEGRAAA